MSQQTATFEDNCSYNSQTEFVKIEDTDDEDAKSAQEVQILDTTNGLDENVDDEISSPSLERNRSNLFIENKALRVSRVSDKRHMFSFAKAQREITERFKTRPYEKVIDKLKSLRQERQPYKQMQII